MVDKATIAQWPEVQELVNEARLECARQNYLANDSNIECVAIGVLSRLYDKCRQDSSMHRRLIIDEIDIMADAHLHRWWHKMLKARGE